MKGEITLTLAYITIYDSTLKEIHEIKLNKSAKMLRFKAKGNAYHGLHAVESQQFDKADRKSQNE